MLRERDGACQDRIVSSNMPPMRKRSLWLRMPLFLLTLLQFSVPAAAAWADARLGEPSGPAHIESHSTAGCARIDRKSTRLNSSHVRISYAVFCLEKNKTHTATETAA